MKGKVIILLALAAAVCSLQAGCSRQEGETVAWVNGRPIKTADFTERLSQLPLYLQQNKLQREKFLESLIDRQLLLNEAQRRKVGGNKEVKERLARAREQIMIEELIRTAVPEAEVSRQAMLEYFQETKESFVEPEKVNVSQILVRREEEARDIVQQLKKGKDFAALARQKSISPDARNGGLIGDFGRGEMLPEFEKVAFALKEGAVSGVVHSPFGYHVLKLNRREDKRQKTFEEAQEEIEIILRQQQQKERLDAWFAELKEKARVKINQALLDEKFSQLQEQQDAPAEENGDRAK